MLKIIESNMKDLYCDNSKLGQILELLPSRLRKLYITIEQKCILKQRVHFITIILFIRKTDINTPKRIRFFLVLSEKTETWVNSLC